jgi:hypothetical protein
LCAQARRNNVAKFAERVLHSDPETSLVATYAEAHRAELARAGSSGAKLISAFTKARRRNPDLSAGAFLGRQFDRA